MIDYQSSTYKMAETLINVQRQAHVLWENIRDVSFLDAPTEEENYKTLQKIVPGITVEQWHEYVDNMQEEELNGIGVVINPPSGILPNQPTTNYKYELDNSYGSAWTSYKRNLAQVKHFSQDEIHSIETSALEILNRLNSNTQGGEPTKGLVIGNVQSGKTANMAGLMAMAADQGWNMFIILSGTIENLRIQTQSRLIADLGPATNVSWFSLDNVDNDPSSPYALRNLNLQPEAKQRYLMVCLKNSIRLKNLLKWLASDIKNRANLKILLIDDEADQAGVNTKTQKGSEEEIERTAINHSIVNLLTNRVDSGKKPIPVKSFFKTLDYVAYTATPYANILNEAPGPESIYPQDFIAALPVSKKYFGPQTIFGVEGIDSDPLNIVNIVPTTDLSKIKKIKADGSLPKSLEDAILWFYCCLAIERKQKVNKPFSMLIHVSQKQSDHQLMADAIKRWFDNLQPMDFIKKCRTVYDMQTTILSKKDFYRSCPLYPDKEIIDYPAFQDISNEIVDIFNNKIQSIKIDEEGNIHYCRGIHLCIDNCAHNAIENQNEHIRLLYPDSKKPLDYASGFIVIGGATLSRGLTIEGLVSTYFLRTIKQADTLMQMGRWFGYRAGYELLPRVWITANTRDQFRFLSILDYELRSEIKEMQESGVTPKLVGPRIRSYPRTSFLILTAKNKQKDALTVEQSYFGFASQTTIFYDDKEILKNNLNNTVSFIESLGQEIDISNHPKPLNCHEWDNVSNQTVLDYISSMQYPKSDSSFLNVQLFSSWYQKIAKEKGLKNWHVVLEGVDNQNAQSQVKIGSIYASKVNRSKKKRTSDDGFIRIGALRNPRDLYIDMDMNVAKLKLDSDQILDINNTISKNYRKIRRDYGFDSTSLLVIYLIDKNSQPLKREKNREPLNTPCDVVGLSLIVPDNKDTSNATYVSVDLSKNTSDDLSKVDIDNAEN